MSIVQSVLSRVGEMKMRARRADREDMLPALIVYSPHGFTEMMADREILTYGLADRMGNRFEERPMGTIRLTYHVPDAVDSADQGCVTAEVIAAALLRQSPGAIDLSDGSLTEFRIFEPVDLHALAAAIQNGS